MTTDYPDWTRLFHLVGTDITIPINIEASDVTLDVNLVASDVTLNVNIAAAAVTLGVVIVGTVAALNVKITASTVTININFSDQSVAVFDAAKWFAHNAAQVFIYGLNSIPQNSYAKVVQYTVPALKNLFIVGIGYRTEPLTAVLWASGLKIVLAAAEIVHMGSVAGGAFPLDTPLRFTAGQVVELWGLQFSSMASLAIYGSMWGYLEDV
jgi:hypothetical protein